MNTVAATSRRRVEAEAPAEEKSLAERSGNYTCMAKPRRKKNFSKFLSGSIDESLAMTTLAAKTAVKVASQTVTDTMRISSVKATYTLRDFTKGANIGPMIFGIAHSDYTVAEIEEWIEATGGWDIGNLVQTREVRNRLIRQVGVFDTPEDAGDSARVNDGRPVRTKLNWLLAEGDGVSFWIYNTGAQPVATTVPDFQIFGKASLWLA